MLRTVAQNRVWLLPQCTYLPPQSVGEHGASTLLAVGLVGVCACYQLYLPSCMRPDWIMEAAGFLPRFLHVPIRQSSAKPCDVLPSEWGNPVPFSPGLVGLGGWIWF